MKKIVKKLDVLTTILITVYIIGNIETILLYSYKSSIDTPNSIWLKYKSAFVENHKNVIFLIIITILIIFSLIIRIKQKKVNKILVGYYIICCFLMIFIAFWASPKFADYYF